MSWYQERGIVPLAARSLALLQIRLERSARSERDSRN